jgi:antirestriction protein ArdC
MTTKTYNASERSDVYGRITAEIVAAIESGAGEWRMPWHHDGSSIARPVNIASRKTYRGINTLAVWIAAQSHGYGSGVWGTYLQWKETGAQVPKGERATTVVL